MTIRSVESKKKRLEAIMKVKREIGQISIDDVNKHLSSELRFSNMKELSQVMRWTKPESIVNLEERWQIKI